MENTHKTLQARMMVAEKLLLLSSAKQPGMSVKEEIPETVESSSCEQQSPPRQPSSPTAATGGNSGRKSSVVMF